MTLSKPSRLMLFAWASLFAAASDGARAQQGSDSMDAMGMHGMGMHGMGMGGMGMGGMGGMGMGGMGMGGMGGMHPGFQMHHGWFSPGMAGCFITGGDAAILAQRLNALHDALALSTAQKPQWDGFASAVVRSNETMQAAYRTMLANMMNMNFAERFNKQLEAMNLSMAELQKVAPALAALYGVLTPEQKVRAEMQFRALGCAI